jgi:small subunit ribosomal protein S4
MNDSKCKICRRTGIKLFLRGERCLSQKCPMVKKPYPPGPKAKKRVKALSEYGKELREKQKLKNWYNL